MSPTLIRSGLSAVYYEPIMIFPLLQVRHNVIFRRQFIRLFLSDNEDHHQLAFYGVKNIKI